MAELVTVVAWLLVGSFVYGLVNSETPTGGREVLVAFVLAVIWPVLAVMLAIGAAMGLGAELARWIERRRLERRRRHG